MPHQCVKKAGLCSSSVPSIVIIEHLRSLLAAIVAAESCAIRHQFGAGAETAVAAGDFPVASGAGKCREGRESRGVGPKGGERGFVYHRSYSYSTTLCCLFKYILASGGGGAFIEGNTLEAM